MKNAQPEYAAQCAVIAWCNLADQSKYPGVRLIYAIPNGSYFGGDAVTRARRGARMKAQGVKPGVPDLCLPVARGGWHGLYIEMKAPKGRATHEQAAWIIDLTDQGYKAVVCHGHKEAISAVQEYYG